MNIKSIIVATCTCLAFVSINANAIVISSEEFFNQASIYSGNLQAAIIDDEEIADAIGSGDILGINEFIQNILSESYLIQIAILDDYVQKVQDFQDAKDKARAAINRIRGTSSNKQNLVYEALPYLLYMGTTSDSEPTTITTVGFDDESLNSVNAFLSNVGLGKYSFVPTAVPEPGTLVLVSAGLVAFTFARRKTRT